jgi:DNA-binding SARP family transcriptional activator/predicted ATPase
MSWVRRPCSGNGEARARIPLLRQNAPMEFRLLGPFEVVDGGRRLDLGPKKQRAILAILTIAATRAVSVDRLIDDLWGDDPPPQAMGTLQAYVSNLRRILEPDRPLREPPRVLVTQRPGYLLAIDRASLDRSCFEDATVEGSRLLAQGSFAAAKVRIAQGLALWRGAALADFAFEPFAQIEATRLEELRLEATEDGLRADLELGDYRSVAAEAEVVLAASPLRERVWGLLMVALYRSGRQAEALKAYQRARHTLADELGIDPSPTLRELEGDILRHAPSLQWQQPTVSRVGGGGPAPESTAGAIGEWAFVGRREELAAMEARLDAAIRGRGGVVVVGGEPGIGKTRLVEELVRAGQAKGVAVAWGGAVEGGASPAYWPWVKIVRSLLHVGDPDRLFAALGAGASELALVVPEVKEVIGSLEPPRLLDPDTARIRLFEAVLGLLDCVARQHPLVVVLDDLQWADAASLQLLGFLGPYLRELPLLVLGTFRPAEVDARGQVTEALVTLGRHGVLERLALRGLGRDEVGDMMVATTGDRASPDVVATVEKRTAGNPFFVAELARLLRSAGELDGGVLDGAVPAGVRDVVRRQLSRLPEDTSALLAVAAVAGREFDLQVLEAAAAIEPDRALEMVEAAFLSGVVSEHSDVIGRFRFSHDLVRETILKGLTAVRRARLHARLAEAIEALHGDDDRVAFELAYHSFHAAPVTGAERCIPAITRAADVATTRLAHEQAEEQLRRAWELVGKAAGGATRDAQEVHILLRLASVLTITKGYADPEIGEMLECARLLCSQGDGEHVVQALFGLVMFHLVAGRHHSARQLAGQLVEMGEESGGPAQMVAAHLAVGTAAVHIGELHVARFHLEKALALREGLESDEPLRWLPMHPKVFASTFLAWTLWELGDRDAAFGLVDAGLAFASQLGHDLTTSHAFDCAARIAVLDRDPAKAREQSEKALALRGRQGSPLYSAIHAVHHGWAIAHLGSPEAGIAEIQAGLAAMEATGAWMIHTLFLALLAEAQRQCGRPQDALASVERGMHFVERTGEHFWEAELYRLRGELMLEVTPERAAEAAADLRTAMRIAGELGAVSLEMRSAESLRRTVAT